MRSRRSEIRFGASQKCASEARPPAARIAWIASTGARPVRGTYPGWPCARSRRNASSTLSAKPGRDEGARDGRAGRARRRGRGRSAATWASIGSPISRRRSTVAWKRVAAGAALAGEGRLERVVRRVDADPQHVELALEQVEAEATGDGVDLDRRHERRGPAGSGAAPGATSSRYPARLSWSASANRRTPASYAWRTSSAGSRTPSERVEWAWTSATASPAMNGSPSSGRGGVARGPGRRHQTSTRRWIRSIWSARPVAGSMSTWQALNTTGPVAHLEPRRQRVDEPRQDGVRVEPDDAPHGAGHAEVGLVGRALGQDPLVAGDDVGVRPDDDADPAVEVQPERVLLARQLAVEVHDPDRRQRLARLVEQPVGVRERVLDRLHVRPALEVDHRDLGPVERLVRAPAAARDVVGAVVERPQDAVVACRGTGRSRACPRCGCRDVITSTPAANSASAVET